MPRFCDIVMKGGITSGVVYPAAVVEIAKTFTFKNVGGTSAGAIAAALTAAAERRRARDGSNAGFDRLGAIPHYLATDNRLFRLFAPNTSTRSLYRTVVALFGRTSPLEKFSGLVRAFPVASLLGAIAGIVSLVAVVRTYAFTPLWLWVIALLIGIATVFAGMAVAVAIALGRDMLGKLPANDYGMVTGIDDADRTSDVALCTWLAKEMELTAGLEPGVAPLTFGMLWNAKQDVTAPGLAEIPPEHDVNLEMMTTNATWGRPYTFPVTTQVFFFDPGELKRFFPDYVVNWMVQRSRPPRDDKEAARFAAYAPRLALPLMGDLPVIVATRMSLAFPILLSAVPLWSPDRTAPPDAQGNAVMRHVWFSDGGISSNFPITLFDSPLPRWPTFAINLAGFPPGKQRSANEADNVAMVARNQDGLLPTFNPVTQLTDFLAAVANAMQNWNDNTQSTLPGYRDRIVTVYLDASEGGLNLDMPPDVLERLRLRGVAAGTLIAQRFAAPSVLDPNAVGMNWENHRWLRLRSTLGSLKEHLTALSRGTHPDAPDVTYDELITAADGTPVHRYPIAAGERTHVSALAAAAATLGDDLDETPTLDDRLPHPPPHLAVRASLKS